MLALALAFVPSDEISTVYLRPVSTTAMSAPAPTAITRLRGYSL
jgi:hypothetical protein